MKNSNFIKNNIFKLKLFYTSFLILSTISFNGLCQDMSFEDTSLNEIEKFESSNTNYNTSFKYLTVFYSYSFYEGIYYPVEDIYVEDYSGYGVEGAWVPSKWGIALGYNRIKSKEGVGISSSPNSDNEVKVQESFDVFYSELQYYLLGSSNEMKLFLFAGGSYIIDTIETSGGSGWSNGFVSVGNIRDEKTNEFGYSFGVGIIWKFIYLKGRLGSEGGTANAGIILKW